MSPPTPQGIITREPRTLVICLTTVADMLVETLTAELFHSALVDHKLKLASVVSVCPSIRLSSVHS